jgi:hypothetical protein
MKLEKTSMAVSKQWTRVRTLGRGASGAEVFLAADDVSGDLFAVKSAGKTAALRREHAIMSVLKSTRVVSCIGGRAGRDGAYGVPALPRVCPRRLSCRRGLSHRWPR